MRIGVVSDTHSKDIPKQLIEDFKSVDLIIHAGDFCSLSDLRRFQKLKEVRAVFGNMDEQDIRDVLPESFVFEIEGVKIGVYHGAGPAKAVLDCVKNKFSSEKVDLLIFGHSHQPLNERNGKAYYFNPGSPNDNVFAPYCSYGIIEINNGKIEGKIVKVK